MNRAKDTPSVRDEFERLQRLAPQRLDRLAETTALIARSVAQTGLVTNPTIAELDRQRHQGPLKRAYRRLEWILFVGAMLITMALTFWLTDFLLTKLLSKVLGRSI